MPAIVKRSVRKAASVARTWLDRLSPQAEAAPVPAPGPGPSTFVPPGHFYSPIPDLKEVHKHADRLFDMAATTIPGVDLREAEQLALMEAFAPLYANQPFGPDPIPGRRFHFENPFYSYSDALFLHFMLRHLRPRRVIEIGSGYSSAVMLDTNDLFLDGKPQFTFIEPYPEVLRSRLLPSDVGVEVLSVPVQEVELDRFRKLEANDILFVDSTHVSKIGSDVNRIFFDILPELRVGVYVHFHDIFYPFEYPRPWVEEGRAWNELYLLRAFLQYNRAFEIVLFNTFLATRHRARLAQLFPLCMRNTGGSIWLRCASPR